MNETCRRAEKKKGESQSPLVPFTYVMMRTTDQFWPLNALQWLQ